MKTTALASALGLMLAVCMGATPARAVSTTYVSISGNDANDCTSPATACGTFSRAQSNTDNGGTIICLSSGNFNGIGVLKSITIDCRGHVAVIPQIFIDFSNVVVILRGLHIYGAYDPGANTGVQFANGNALHIEDCKIAGVTSSVGGGKGLRFAPRNASQLYVTDSVISENGFNDNSGGGGIFIEPTGSGSARVVLNRVTMNQNTIGIVVDGTGSSGAVNAFISDSVIGGTIGPGVVAKNSTVSIDRSQIVNNSVGVIANNGATALLSNSTIQGNSQALNANTGAAIFSYGNNNINANQPGGIGSAPTVIGQH